MSASDNLVADRSTRGLKALIDRPSRYSLRTWGHLALVAAAIGATSAPAAGQGSEPGVDVSHSVPEIIWAKGGQREYHPYPYFVSADRALSPDGDFDSELFSEGSRVTLQNYWTGKQTSKPCAEAMRRVPAFDPSEIWTGFESILADADIVVLGQVTGARQGFWFDSPGAAVRIEPVSWLKSSDDWREKYLFFVSMDFEVAGQRLCVRDDRFPRLPKVGEQVLVSYRDSSNNRDQPMFFVDPAQIITFPKDGRASLPLFLQEREEGLADVLGPELVERAQRMITDGGAISGQSKSTVRPRSFARSTSISSTSSQGAE